MNPISSIFREKPNIKIAIKIEGFLIVNKNSYTFLLSDSITRTTAKQNDHNFREVMNIHNILYICNKYNVA